ncbi:DinB family protein [Umezawaea tangerina]|uniref:Uncharacterized protein DUF664 n=1 Tax=Umezawaea tangerina TaxID=84725 RepID=A0A2T0TGT5_9PSEU|nr:DinB family protein [Umezawaea tangerina]PRY44906.1 uncharacterized protein DUF664 [Umezawaea tangerina]
MTTSTPTTVLDAELTDLLAALATARAGLVRAVDGLSDEQAGLTPTASALCLGGLVKHVASMEQAWLRFAVEGPSAMSFDLPEGVTWADFTAGTAREFPQWAIDHQAEFRMLPDDTLDGILARYRDVAARTEEVAATLTDLSATHPLPEVPWNEPGAVRSVRGVFAHLIIETARHAGHADILRESIDGRTSF